MGYEPRVLGFSRVKGGEPVCRSGSVGFSPEPHLHLEAHPASVRNAVAILSHSIATIVICREVLSLTRWLLERHQDPMGPSLAFAFLSKSQTADEGSRDTYGARSKNQFTPMAGRWYDATGEVSPAD